MNIWFKYGTFNGIPDNSSTELIPIQVDDGLATTSATLNNGQGTITFKAAKTGIVFFKWKLARETNGGGKLDVFNSKSIILVS